MTKRTTCRTAKGVKPEMVSWIGITVVLCLIAGLVGGALSRNFGTSSYTISYADFIAILLSAVSVLLTLLGLILAILAFIGWKSITGTVENRTEQFLDDGFQEGNPLRDLVIARTREIMFAGILDLDAENEADDTDKPVEPGNGDEELGREEK